MKTKKKNHIIFSIILLILFSILFLQGGGFQAVGKERRIALIIGNAHYKSSPLSNPVNDATDMARVLRELGFDVMLRTNAGQKEMENAIREFGKKLQKGGVGLFYFSGHGMQVKGVNYLIPVNEDIQEENEIKFKAVDANFVLSKMDSAGNQMNVMILDACRDNPFKRSFRSSARGLVQMDAPQGSLIVYATSPGKTAADGEGRNGIFTKHLLKAIRETDLEVGQLLREVRRGVMNETDSNQVPWESSSLTGNFYFSTLRPEPPETSRVDISSIKKATKERERIKSKWDNWQTGMKSDFMEVEKLDKSTAYTNPEKKKAWRQFLDNYKTDNPYSREDDELRQRAAQRLKALSELDIAVRARVSLRSMAGILSENEVSDMLKRKNFFSKRYDWNKNFCNPRGDFANEYEVKTIRGDKVVLDHATGLMWHQSGSEKSLYYRNGKLWIDELNRRGYAGYSDWRLPTLEEGASLIERSEMNGYLCVDPLFSAKQIWIWTSDATGGAFSRVWFVGFAGGGYVNRLLIDVFGTDRYVRPVRSGQK